MRENFPLKNPSSLNDDSFSQSLNMPIFKNNKRIFLNQLEKYTSDLLNHLEDLDLNQPKDLSQITDVLSDDLMSERKKNSPMFGKKDYFNKDCQIFPKIFSEKKQFLPSNLNLYYETKGYKNYKYKLFEIDLDEIGKCQKLGRKFDVKKYKEKRSYEKIRSVDSKMNDHKKNKKNNLLILTKKIKKVSENEIQEFLQDLESKESEIDNKNNKSLLPKIQQSKFSIINETIINYKDKIHDKINHLINITNRNGSSLVKLDKNPKEPLIIESFSFNQFKEESNYDNDDKLMKIQMNFLEITKILYKCESMHVSKSKVKLNTDSKKEIKILNEFILLCKDTTNNCYDKKKTEKCLYLDNFKENFDIFKNNDKDINNRILLAFGINPYLQTSKINWETYLKFKKVIVIREANLNENIEFILNYFSPERKNIMKFDEFKFILRNLCNKIDKYLEIHETLVFDYFLENIELTGSIVFGKENMEVNMEIFKKALSNLTLHYRYFLILIVKTF